MDLSHGQAHDRPALPPLATPTTIDELNANLTDILARGGGGAPSESAARPIQLHPAGQGAGRPALWCDQGVIAGCAGGTYDNICDAADILRGPVDAAADEFSLTRLSRPASRSSSALVKNGAIADSDGRRAPRCAPPSAAPASARATCPANGGLSIRHTTRNFPNREGSKPGNGQIAVGGADGRALHRGHRAQRRRAHPGHRPRLSASPSPEYVFDGERLREPRVRRLWQARSRSCALKFGPNIKDWPEMPAADRAHLLLEGRPPTSPTRSPPPTS